MDYRGPEEIVSTVNRVALCSGPTSLEFRLTARSLQFKAYQKTWQTNLASKPG
jgi:hypothetical protein